MTLGERLRQYVRGEMTQKGVALTWFEAMTKAGYEWKPAHVESQLSRCLADQVAAIKFFFADRDRGRALLEALGAPPSDVEPILQLADEALASNGERAAKLAVDLTPWSGSVESKKLFDAVRVAIIEDHPLKPAVLLVTREQYDDLPRSFDRERDWLEVRCVERDHTIDKLDSAVLILSANPFDPSHWAAIGFRDGALVFEPGDALSQFRALGSLALPAVEHDLASYLDDDNLPEPRLPRDGIEHRRWMTQLRCEQTAMSVDPDPLMRLAIARSLGVTAVATTRDRIEHELAVAAASHAGARQTDRREAIAARCRRAGHPGASRRCRSPVDEGEAPVPGTRPEIVP